MSVSMKPGATAFAVPPGPSGAASRRANARVCPMTPAFENA